MESNHKKRMKMLKSRRKLFLLLSAMLMSGIATAQSNITIDGNVFGGGNVGQVTESTTVNMKKGTVKGSVFGGGKGTKTDETAGLVEGNTLVNMTGGLVESSVYGGGELGSVGTFTTTEVTYATGANAGTVVNVPSSCAANTGLAKVLISGGQVGANTTYMPTTLHPDDDVYGYVFCGGQGEADSISYPKAIAMGVVDTTYLEISNTALITASVYGGSENGMTLSGTHVKVTGGQIGTGYNAANDTHDDVYSSEDWQAAIDAVTSGSPDAINAAAGRFHECDHFPYGIDDDNDPTTPDVYHVYDIFADQYNSNGGSINGSNGHTFFGNVFGGGSGYYPIWDAENDTAVWRRAAGRVCGSTFVEITGGHILTSVYGGNEITDVKGKSTVKMSGGTLGVPRTLNDIAAHPVTCYLFGASMGDSRPSFSTWSNVDSVYVEITGGTIFGSVFSGGEDGHVLGNVRMNISDNAHIGTWGYSYVDGNVFGGGRGFSGETIFAGSVGGNVNVNISNGTVLGSVYGGGRLASTGIGFSGILDPIIGYFQPDADGVTHGHVTINISGGTIGNDYESKLHLGNPDLEGGRSYGGNVFGGSMGRLTKLDNNINPLWPILGQVKTTEVNISNNAIIKGNVYGGGEFGLVLDTTNVNISGGTIWRSVYGGGYGSNDHTTITDVPTAVGGVTFRYTPMAFAGVVSKTANVNISGGWVKKNVYGGGERGSVGLIDYSINADHEFINITKHENEANSFALSWPYKYEYFEGFTGNTHVNITGGRIGITGKDFMGPWNASGTPMVMINGEYVAYDGSEAHQAALKAAREDNGDVYGGGHGIAGDRYDMAFCANADSTSVIVNYTSTDAIPTNYAPSDWQSAFYPTAADWATYGTRGCIAGSVYGGGENGHVLDLAEVTFTKGLIGHAIYGGGKGKDTYTVNLLNLGSTTEYHNAEIYSITAGKVYGNTVVTLNANSNNDAYVLRNIYGGGNMASVGKGNYAGGSDDYSIAGYGEKVSNLWSGAVGSDAWHFLNSGKTTVTVTGGTVGTASGTKDDLPTGNVFGGCRGEAAPNVPNSPRYHYAPSFFSGYVNKTDVTIGRLAQGTQGEQGYVPASGPIIYGSVYGGGQDGHVRRSTNVTVNYGEVGLAYTTTNINNVGTDDLINTKWLNRGNVFGGGTGLSKYEYDLPPYNGTIEENHEFTYTYGGRTITLKEKDYSNSSGSVTDSTMVTVNGGTVYHNVYGGGSLASVGPPFIPGTIHGGELGQASHWSKNIVTVANGTVGESAGVIAGYGGHVFGASRGDASLDISRFSTSVQTQATIGDENTTDALVYGNVYGGGEIGIVSDDTEANVVSGQVGTIDYTDANSDGTYDGITHVTGGNVYGGGMGLASNADAARVKGNSNVNISGGHVFYSVYGGGEMGSVGQHTEVLADSNDPDSEVIDFVPVDNTGFAKVTVTGGQVGPAPKVESGYNIPVGLTGIDGYVFGGGQGIGDDPISNDHPYGQYYQIANVNYTSVTVDIPATADTVLNRIWGSVFGGSEDGHVLGSDTVHYVSGFLGTKGTTSKDGNIFGGGRNFSKKNYTAGRTRGNTTVEMTGGQIFGNIYGGGRLALTGTGLKGLTHVSDNYYTPMLTGDYGKTKVMVKGGIVGNNKKTNANPDDPDELLIETFSQYSMGNVYGGGMGDMGGVAGHPAASALLLGMTKDTEVEISGDIEDTHVYGIVFGGGETANVGQYTWKQVGTTVSDISITEGLAKVTISGGTVGADRAKMRYEAGDAPYNMYPKYNDDLGYVYGGGEGDAENPNDPIYPQIQYGDDPSETVSLLDLMATVNNTEVSVSGGWVKASVFGGGESGHVRGNTKVTISGGQIGAGNNTVEDKDELYDDEDFVNPLDGITTSLYPTAHWDYGEVINGVEYYNPYDPVYVMNGTKPSDGKSWFGNVFGGGSGWFPYIVNEGTESNPDYKSKWNPNSGKVWGNTEVIITGGHILNNVFGGNESTDVGDYGYADAAYHSEHPEVPVGAPYIKSGGKATVSMSGGTVGVPRTVSDIALQPNLGSVFGGGCGDPRTIFNTLNNVDSTHVEITGGIVYGTVFGGAEDGHVLDSTNVRISQAEGKTTVIGSSGLSGYDGHVFGGGKGKDHYLSQADMNFAAGRVGGNTHVKMTNGTVLGCIFGGGNVALTGVDVNGSFNSYINTSHVYDSTYHGRTMVEVSGGYIGNNAHDGLDLLMSDNDLGNVYGGGRGNPDEYIEDDLGRVANAIVRISGNTTYIYGSVFGGGQMANVGHWNYSTTSYTAKTGATHVSITESPTIGTELEFDHGYSIGTGNLTPKWTWYDTVNGMRMISHTCTGNVFGGGQGDVEIDEDGTTIIGTEQGHCHTTNVDISGTPTIMSSVFGGSEDGKVWGNTSVKISGGTIGTTDIAYDSLKFENNNWVFVHADSTYSFGNVFGGSYGKDAIIHLEEDDPTIMSQVNSVAGRIYGDTYVEITGGAIRGNVFGGSNYGTVEGNTEVKISKTGSGTGPEIGPLDYTGLNAYVLGGGKGFHEDPDELRKAYANVNGNTKVTVEGGKIWGSVFGGGSDAHTLGNTEIYIHDGANIGKNGLSTWDGNIFGGGRNFLNTNHTNGRVAGNVTITMDGGSIQGSIFGGGRLALTGVDEDGNPFLTDDASGHVYDDENHGKVTITVSGSNTSIGNPNGEQLLKGSDESVGDIFGSGKGDTKDYDDIWAGRVANTKIEVKDGPRIYGSVFGGGEMASIGYWYENSSHKQVFYENTGTSEVIIGENASDGLVIGTLLEYDSDYAEDPSDWTIYETVDGVKKLIHTCTGNVFGACQGDIDITAPHWVSMGRSRTSKVTVNGGTIMSGVFGGPEQGTVAGHTSVTINNGTIGTVVTPSSGSPYNFGRVIGGGYGCDDLADLANTYTLDGDPTVYNVTNDSISLGGNWWRPDYISGRVYGHSRVYFNNGTLYGDVFGGSDRSIVSQERVVNINGGTVKGNVFGGGNSETTNTQIGEVLHSSLKTVNIRGGHIEGSVFGSSNKLEEGISGQTDGSWQSFVNITGGTIDGDVHAAGFAGKVFGSVCVNIGANAINKAPNKAANLYRADAETGSITPAPSADNNLVIKGNVYGGSNLVLANQTEDHWNTYDISRYSKVYIDGTDYDTRGTTAPYMDIQGGLFGSGTHCESGEYGREIVLRKYGHRNTNADGDLTTATRTLTTAQRISNFVMDESNVNFSGYEDISGRSDSLYAVVKITDTMFVANASSLVLGSVDEPVFMDSIRNIRSCYLTSGDVYDNPKLRDLPWGWIGLKATSEGAEANELLYMNSSTAGNTLTKAQENVILFNGTSTLWVRYWTENTQYYGELNGFFRMRADHFEPYGRESFAYARQKLTVNNNGIPAGGTPVNTSDGGFISYDVSRNFHTLVVDGYPQDGNDGGDNYTQTKQYPYYNVLETNGRDDMQELRLWAIPRITGNRWYVDGRSHGSGGNGIGVNDMTNGRGLYPDMPKLTVSRDATSESDDKKGIYAGANTLSGNYVSFDQEKDAIYVVGAISSTKELAVKASGLLSETDDASKPLRLYRYPGGHPLSSGSATDPGANYKAMVEVEACSGEQSLTLNNVRVNGLYGYDGVDEFNMTIPATFNPKGADVPLVIAHAGSVLNMNAGTVLLRGYNKLDADLWYKNADYEVPANVYHGGALFVDETATVNLSGLVTAHGNLQYRKIGNTEHPVECNVYLPTFDSHLFITDNLDERTRVGVTSPKRNKEASYLDNTLSPVAEVVTAEHAPEIANLAWEHCNFLDDQGWFFVSGNKTLEPVSPRTTYYNGAGTKTRNNRTLYFGWTWASVVRTAPTGYSDDNIDSPEDMAWLITSVPDASLKQTVDLDMKQYVWVPIGDDATPFEGDFDGQGHLIKNLIINYIGTGDLRYERANYGMFGNVHNGTVNRTFVVSGTYKPYVSDLNGTAGKNIGGLVGYMDGTSLVSNSEAAVMIVDYNNNAAVTGNVMGGLVATMIAGEVHSSMAMSNLSVGQNYHGILGGLVGHTTGGSINNSFVNGTFGLHADASVEAGGLVGDNAALVRNCYVTWHDGYGMVDKFGSLAASNTTDNNIQYSYFKENGTFNATVSEGSSVAASCKPYSPVYSADMLGYMYADNMIEDDTAMFVRLNENVGRLNGSTSHKYAQWARPGLSEINGDLPVLLLCNYDAPDASGRIGAGDFRNMGTYAGGPALQYGGPVRDAERQIDSALVRTKASDANDYLFIYGDITEKIKLETGKFITQSKVSVHEHASILDPGALGVSLGAKGDYTDTYVGISFDNSKGSATATYGVNYGLSGGSTYLPRDWHMFSTPLAHAPLGFDYQGHNVANSSNYNNPWVNQSMEFSWLNDGHGGNNRYWMKGWTNSQGPLNPSSFVEGDWVDGYFPSNIADPSQFGETCIENTDEWGRYPYGMDFYTWTEPDYHWINFKRNGPNHWHSDGDHEHIDYEPVAGATLNVNEENLIVGRGYMAAIATPTLLQSHGTLNTGVKSIELTSEGKHCKGWNLVGNPYHAYIDFDKLARANSNLLAKEGTHPFYVVYNADGYEGTPGDAFVYYVESGSKNGAYAGQYIHPHQGFYVKMSESASADDHLLDFTDGTGTGSIVVSRETAGEAPFRDEQPEYPLVNLFLSSDNGCNDVTVIELERPEWGGAVKLRELRNGNGVFYAQHDNTHFAALFAKVGTERVPLWFEAKEDDIYTIKWNTANGDFHSMYLIDNKLGVQYDMLRNDTYSFEGHVGDYPSRFYIVFNVTDVDEHLEGNGFVFFDESQWIVTGEGDLEFIDVQGQILLRKHVEGGQSRVTVPDVAPGVYLFRLSNSEGTRVQKVIVKR